MAYCLELFEKRETEKGEKEKVTRQKIDRQRLHFILQKGEFFSALQFAALFSFIHTFMKMSDDC